MFTGDLENNGQLAAVASGADLRVDVLKVPHHGSSRQASTFWAATQARVAVFSVGAHNDYGHPAASSLRLASRLGMRIVRTDQQSAVAVVNSRSGQELLTQRPP